MIVRFGASLLVGVTLVALALPACGAKTGLRVGADGGLETGGTGGGGTGGTSPVDAGQRARADKIDLLFMIDGSGSMADKQEILALTIPDMVRRLNNPLCVSPDGLLSPEQPEKATAPCPAGFEREFNPVQDMHIGVISSSIGDHGAQAGCGPLGANENDRGHLLDRGAFGQTYQDHGFLAWDPARTKQPPGRTNPDELEDLVRRLVVGVGETGCAAEASLEAWYRFLVDPEPYDHIVLGTCDPGVPCAVVEGVDDVLLEQRAHFLRPDSLVAIIMLTDENDCSVKDDGKSYRVLEPTPISRASSACAASANDVCCRSCADTSSIAGCPPLDSDPECQKGPYASGEDSAYLRCFAQKRRFGFDAMNPIERYVKGLTELDVPRRDGLLVPNPLYHSSDSSLPARHPSLIFLAGIVGVPWQDIARDHRDPNELHYMSAEELKNAGVWDIIVGDAANGVLPTDPFMVESIEERTGKNPVTGDSLSPSSSADPNANPINGHEMLLDYAGIDLQYACTFELPEPRDCGGAGFYCDCGSSGFGSAKPICQNPDGSYGSTQYRAKAYPGIRQLQVLKGIGSNAIVASICARNVTDPARQDYGYRPALRAILDRLSDGLL